MPRLTAGLKPTDAIYRIAPEYKAAREILFRVMHMRIIDREHASLVEVIPYILDKYEIYDRKIIDIYVWASKSRRVDTTSGFVVALGWLVSNKISLDQILNNDLTLDEGTLIFK